MRRLISLCLLVTLLWVCIPAALSHAQTETPTPEPTATETPEPTATETPEPTATQTPEPTATQTPEPTATETPEPTATETPEPTATETPEPTATETPEPTATETPEPTATETPEPTATETPEPTATETPEPTATETPEPTATETPEPTATQTPEPTATQTPVPTATQTPEPTATETPEPTATGTATSSPTATTTSTPSATATITPTRTATPTRTPTGSPTPTSTTTPTATSTATRTPTLTATATATATPTPTFTPTATSTPVPTSTATATPTPAPSDSDGDGQPDRVKVQGAGGPRRGAVTVQYSNGEQARFTIPDLVTADLVPLVPGGSARLVSVRRSTSSAAASGSVVRASTGRVYEWTAYDLGAPEQSEVLGTTPLSGSPLVGCFSGSLVLARFVRGAGIVNDTEASTITLPKNAVDARCGAPDGDGLSPIYVLSGNARRGQLSTYDIATGSMVRTEKLPPSTGRNLLFIAPTGTRSSVAGAVVTNGFRTEIVVQRSRGLASILVPEVRGRTVRAAYAGFQEPGVIWVQLEVGTQIIEYRLPVD